MGVLFWCAHVGVHVWSPFWNGLSELHKTLIGIIFTNRRRTLNHVWESSYLCCVVHHRNIQLKSKDMIQFSKVAVPYLFFTFNLICQILHCPLHSNLPTCRYFQKRSLQRRITHEVHLEVGWDVKLIRLVNTLCVRTEWGCCFLPRIHHLDEEYTISVSYFNMLSHLVFVDSIKVPKVISINNACPANNHPQVKETFF